MKLLADTRLGVLQRGLPGLQEAGDADLALDLPIEQSVAQLRDGAGVGAGAGGADARRRGRAGVDFEALARVGSVAGVGQVMAGDFYALLLGLQRAGAEIESSKEAGHKQKSAHRLVEGTT